MTGKEDGRAERLKAALRDNLRRRKAQERARGAEPGADARTPAEPEPPADRDAVPDSDKTRL